MASVFCIVVQQTSFSSDDERRLLSFRESHTPNNKRKHNSPDFRKFSWCYLASITTRTALDYDDDTLRLSSTIYGCLSFIQVFAALQTQVDYYFLMMIDRNRLLRAGNNRNGGTAAAAGTHHAPHKRSAGEPITAQVRRV